MESAQQSIFYGAFVAFKRPAPGYGPYILAFKKSIERISPLTTSVYGGEGGFLYDIPVNNETLSHIVIEDWITADVRTRALAEGVKIKSKVQACEWLQEKCKKWTGKEVKVVLHSEAQSYISIVEKMNLGVPKEWSYNCKDLKVKNPQLSRSEFLPSRL